ncbi:hypothetical protein EXIGLDRAFT_697342 [Exidia glandulosa HHB12029]|uniref:Uncharacterized protein n=1 Tax=Exidia glandulosa HHB12029 TaxID=1314781 RepID=A0A165ETJ3_EXIGL|nr:hypothetical protein EXIGLDRAFT_697342 [Exidia glandulosa HHB12029]
MRVTTSVRRLHPQLIHFLGKRAAPTHAHEPAPHPQAPADVASHFQDFLRKISSYTAPARASSSKASGSGSGSKALNFWDAPTKLTQTAVPLTDAEMDAVLSGGASLSR